ncbi:B12-binding domain-containing radical SAM protein [Pontiella agarivorans]|uniref:Radical SAM protein n=1 Tax=Pontiella agarivorans TaxID=3038953 RepID=A0ABU5MW45_9BACT|nr:radical SAM protein [Pontiella agarivorans]MDZ8118413.1 radical SAM protein [Pontiella agarivorans]
MKIAFIAMSGIRACDPELLELGLTLPGFVERSKQIASLPSLGLLTLAGMTPSHHDVCYMEVPDITAEPNELKKFDLVAISSFSAQINEAYELSARYRAMGVPTVIGGPHVTARPHEARKFCTSVVIGEGEPVWHEILADAEQGKLKVFYDARGLDFDLADAPMPAFELLDIEKYNRLTVQTSRGCPHNCSFCAGSNLICNRYKQKPAAKVLAEIDRICAIWPHPFIEFADDNSFVNKAYWKALLPELKKRRIKWFTETDLSVAEDPELLRLMRESGCAQVLIGLESPTPGPLDHLEINANWKRGRFAAYKKAILSIQSHGITVNGCFIVGLDGQTSAVFDDIFTFVKETELYEVQITILTAFPSTPLYEQLKQEHRLIEPTNWRKCTLFDLNFRPRNMTAEELTSGFRQLGVKLYSEAFTGWRRDTFKTNLRKSARLERISA